MPKTIASKTSCIAFSVRSFSISIAFTIDRKSVITFVVKTTVYKSCKNLIFFENRVASNPNSIFTFEPKRQNDQKLSLHVFYKLYSVFWSAYNKQKYTEKEITLLDHTPGTRTGRATVFRRPSQRRMSWGEGPKKKGNCWTRSEFKSGLILVTESGQMVWMPTVEKMTIGCGKNPLIVFFGLKNMFTYENDLRK